MDDGAQTFRTSPAAYDRHIGRYGRQLGRALIDLVGVAAADRVLDVGCGTGLLTAELEAVVGAEHVSAIDPSEEFLRACQERVPGADVRSGRAEQLPFADGVFNVVFSQLVVNFLTDPAAGVQEMRRVTRPGGTVAAAVWDYAEGMTLLRTFWDAADLLDQEAVRWDEGLSMPRCRPESLRGLWEACGLHDVEVSGLWPAVVYQNFDELWTPFLAGVAPSGVYTAALDEEHRQALREELFRRLGRPPGTFRMTARAWAVSGRR